MSRAATVHLLEPYNVPIDPLDYRVSQSFAREVTPKQLRRMNVQVIVYSDAYPFLVLRDPAVSSRENDHPRRSNPGYSRNRVDRTGNL